LTVGDVVNGKSGVAAVLVVQPAAGVSLMITACAFYGNVVSPFMTDGTTVTTVNWGTAGVSSTNNGKLFLNNTIYMRFQALPAGEVSYFTGIQVQ